MLYLGIDQHARQITISLRDESGDVVLARQVSTRPEKIQEFFQRLTRERLQSGESFVAVLEVCGFNDWLIRMLRDYRCDKVVLIQPDERKLRKTDRRDAAALSEVLWVNRDRLMNGKPVRGLPSSRHCQHHGSGGPATDHVTQGCPSHPLESPSMVGHDGEEGKRSLDRLRQNQEAQTRRVSPVCHH